MPPKKDPDSTALHKGLKMFITLLTTGRKWSLTELAEELNCSKQTVLNQFDSLSATEWGMATSEIKNGKRYFHIDRPLDVLPLALTRDCLNSLELCLSISGKIMPVTLKDELEKFRLVLANYLPKETANKVGQAPTLTLSKGHIDYTPFENTLKFMLEAIDKQQTVDVTYRKKINETPHTFLYAPKGIMNYRESIYITGWLVNKKTILEPVEEKTLALQRILGVEPGEQHTTINIKMPQGLEDGSFGVMELNPFNLQARFSAQVATYISERQWSEGQKMELDPKDGSLTLKMRCRSTPEAITWISSFGPEVQVISPAWLVKEIKKRLALTSAVYEES